MLDFSNPSKRGFKTELANSVGVTPRHMCDIFKGKVEAGRMLALRLEMVTGISCVVWAWPKFFTIKTFFRIFFPWLDIK